LLGAACHHPDIDSIALAISGDSNHTTTLTARRSIPKDPIITACAAPMQVQSSRLLLDVPWRVDGPNKHLASARHGIRCSCMSNIKRFGEPNLRRAWGAVDSLTFASIDHHGS
jgi:hypothetical protein